MYSINGDQLLRIVLQLVFSLLICNALDKDADTELSLTASQGGLAALPCHTSARAQIALIIWYRANSEVPIYTIDLRSAGAHKHTSNTTRLRFDLDRRTLYVHNVSRALDQVRFRCRVDYRKHRSENTYVTLNVTVLPKSVVVVDSEGQKLEGTIGPFKEHSSLRLICEAEGGDPPPKLQWYHGFTSLQATSSSQIKFVRSELRLRNLTRSQLGSIYTCAASTGAVSIDTSVQLDINLRPLTAHISLERTLANDSWPSNDQNNSTLNRIKSRLNAQTLNKSSNQTKSMENKKQILQLVDDQPVEIYCSVVGSRPTPTFSWFLDDQKLSTNYFTQWPPSNSRAPPINSLNSRPSFNSDSDSFYSAQFVNNQTSNNLNSKTFAATALIPNQHLAISTLHFKPTADADGKKLICRAENSLLSEHRISSVESHIQLDIQYAPRLRIQLGANLRRIQESNDAYFECEVHSNPRLNEQIQWYFLREPTSLSSPLSNLKAQYSSSQSTTAANIANAIINSANTLNPPGKNASIERIFSKHVPSSSRAAHATSLVFLDATSADNWINTQQQLPSSKNSILDEDWLSLAASQNSIASFSSKNDQMDLKYFQLVTGGTNVIVADSSLVLQKVQRTQRGLYICSASNSRGRTFSKPIFLNVNYAPICEYPPFNHHASALNSQNKIHQNSTIHHVHNHAQFINKNSIFNQKSNVNNQLIINPLNDEPVRCTVDSVLSSNLKFHWMLSLASNAPTTSTNVDLNQRKLNQHTTVAHNFVNVSSIFLLQDAFLALNHRNGQLLCWAENEIGTQKIPCVFNLIKAGPPEDLKSCSVSNETTESLLIYCLLGNNGGLEFRFHLEVFDGNGQFVAGQSTQCNSSNNEFSDKVNSNNFISRQGHLNQQTMQDQSSEDGPQQHNRVVFLTSSCNVDKAESIMLLSNLEAHQQYTLVAYTENSKGRSESLKFTASTVDVPARRTGLGDKQISPSLGSLFGALICVIGFGLSLLPVAYLLKRIRDRSSPDCETTSGKMQQSVATVTNYMTENVFSEDSFVSEKYDPNKLKARERPLQVLPNGTTSHVSITTNHFGNELTGIAASPTTALLTSEEIVNSHYSTNQYNQLPLVDYYADQYISSSAVNQWPVVHNNSADTLYMLGEQQQLKLVSNAHPQSLHLHPQNNAAFLINQLQNASLYSNSPGLLTPNLNSPNIELATLTKQNIY